MPPSAASTYVYCTASDVDAILSIDGSLGRTDDDASGTQSATEAGYMTRAIQWATARCNLYLLGKVAASDLAQSWIVNQWCSIIAAYFVSCRRGNPAAASLKELYEETMEDLKLVRSGEAILPDAPLRSAAWPAWSNLSHTLRHRYRTRVQPGLSESRGGKPDYVQHTDWSEHGPRDPFG